MKRVLILTVLLVVGMLFVGCSSLDTVMAPAGDAPNPQESDGKLTPEEMGGQSGATSDEPLDLPEAVAE